ncbi:MAG: S8 family serine peptidase [Phycisphaerales bacterium]
MKHQISAMAAALIALNAGSLHAADLGSPAPKPASNHVSIEMLAASAGTPDVRLLVEHPESTTSTASRINDDRADKLGRVPAPTPGYTIHARVIAKSSLKIQTFEASVRTQHAARINGIQIHPSVSDYIVFESPSILAAAELRDALNDDPRFSSAELDITPPRTTRAVPNDPGMPGQWFLRNTRRPEVDLNVEPVWLSGITGAGVTVGIVEGGWQTDHPDITPNFNESASMPMGSATSHSTSCAGLIAAAAFNDRGGAGVAYGANVSNLVYGSNAATADALAFKPDLNHIKSNSWGPPDFGILATIPSIELDALAQSAQSGRAGLGTIYTWAAGNGGLDDRVDYDPYASSRHTIAVGAIGDLDVRAEYNEPGSSLFIVVPSSGNQRRVFTTANGSSYNPGFGGTSAACPLAAGVIALMLESNPALSARDVQHILAHTARTCDPSDAGWTTNGAGLNINYHYGFGAIDAAAAVSLAQTWQTVPQLAIADTGVVSIESSIPDNNASGITRSFVISDAINAEHVELVLDVSSDYIGDLRITLTSPSGTESILAENRDDPQNDLTSRVFTTVRHWNESAQGEWTVNIADLGPFDPAEWHAARLVVYGTPSGPTPCSPADVSDPIGTLNFFDVAGFIALFNAGDSAADFDQNQVWNFFDIAEFIASYNAGCP